MVVVVVVVVVLVGVVVVFGVVAVIGVDIVAEAGVVPLPVAAAVPVGDSLCPLIRSFAVLGIMDFADVPDVGSSDTDVDGGDGLEVIK